MAKLTDPEIENCYQNALRNWRYEGYIVYKKDALAWMVNNLEADLFDQFSRLLYEFVVIEGGEIDQVVEQRFNWIDQWSHHYDLRPIIDGRKFYVETRLSYKNPGDPDDPIIYVVNVKPA